MICFSYVVIVPSFYVYSKFEVIYNIFMWIQMFVISRGSIFKFLDVGYEFFFGGEGGGG